MKTLLKDNTSKRWYPTLVSEYIKQLKIESVWGDENGYRTKRNISYSLQYLQYIQKQLVDLNLSSVITTMLFKTYIITGMGIVEALLVNLLKRNGMWKQSEWKSIGSLETNEKSLNEQKVKLKTEILEKCEYYDINMDLDSMIKRVEKKSLIEIDHDNFPVLKKLRQLRNRVHLQVGDNHLDHDYNAFNYNEKEDMRKILYILLTNQEFCNCPENLSQYDFLRNNGMDE